MTETFYFERLHRSGEYKRAGSVVIGLNTVVVGGHRRREH
jgi:hypothetical protein